jgi:hypothetical protein
MRVSDYPFKELLIGRVVEWMPDSQPFKLAKKSGNINFHYRIIRFNFYGDPPTVDLADITTGIEYPYYTYLEHLEVPDLDEIV